METTSVFSVKPIGHMKSVFHLKNGTPRQSSLCQNARGILVIDKSVFNNPEHSLDGLQHYSHAWILFVFHKNNNPHKKAKVKPPRLDGQRVGVFSTRSPYRPNNIGLSLAKIDKIEGASIHFSGIDIIDGTPIIDIKPYIPQYDRPTPVHQSSPLNTNDFCNDSKLVGNTAKYHTDPKTSTVSNIHSIQNHSKGLNPSNNKSDSSNESISPEQHMCIPMEEGFNSMSSAPDKAGETLKHRVEKVPGDDDDSEGRENCTSKSTVENSEDINSDSPNESQVNSVPLGGSISDNDNDDNLLEFLVGNVICNAASDVLLTNSSTKAVDSSVACEIKSAKASNASGSRNSDNQDEGASEIRNSEETTTVKNINCDTRPNSAVIAPWLSSPPVSKVRVVFSLESLDQLQSFHPSASDPRYRTKMLEGPEDAKKAITSVLYEEPRSIYRRQKCQNSVYFFAIDVLHVTCWFDGDTVNVLRIRPSADVPQLQGKKEAV